MQILAITLGQDKKWFQKKTVMYRQVKKKVLTAEEELT